MRIFKLILAVALMMFVVNSPALAARHSTAEEMRYALNESVHALRKTDGYFDVIKNKLGYNALILQIESCESRLREIKAINELKIVDGKEAPTCLLITEIILQHRIFCLSYVKCAVDALLKKDEEDFRYYMEKFSREHSDAEKWRAKFKADYGY